MYRKAMRAAELGLEALRALDEGVQDDGFVAEEELVERARARLREALLELGDPDQGPIALAA